MRIIAAALVCAGCSTTTEVQMEPSTGEVGTCTVPASGTPVPMMLLGSFDHIGGCLVGTNGSANSVDVVTSAAAYAAAIDATACPTAASLPAVATVDFTSTELLLVNSASGEPDFLFDDGTTRTLSLFYAYSQSPSARDFLFVLNAGASPNTVTLATCIQTCTAHCGPAPL